MSYDPKEQRDIARALRESVEEITADMVARHFPVNGVCEGQVEPGVLLADGRVIAAADHGKPVLLKRPPSWP